MFMRAIFKILKRVLPFWIFPAKMFSSKGIVILLLLLTIVRQVKFEAINSKENSWDDNIKTVVKQGLSLEFPLFDFGQVLDDATNVFGKVVRKMLAQKRLLGFDANKWYW